MKLQELFTELIEVTCVNCGNIVDENLRKWFSDKWVNIGKKKKVVDTHHVVKVERNFSGYAYWYVYQFKSKAARMTKKQKPVLLVEREQHRIKKGRGGTSSLKGGGKKPIMVSTKPKK